MTHTSKSPQLRLGDSELDLHLEVSSNMPLDLPLGSRILTAAVSGPSQPTPKRRPHSIRRTSTLDIDWPKGMSESARVRGDARDLLTGSSDSHVRVLNQGWIEVHIGPERVYESLSTAPEHTSLQRVVGVPRSQASRKIVAQLVPEESYEGSPLFLLLDDLPGIYLASGEVMLEWSSVKQLKSVSGVREQMPRDVCAGYERSSSAFLPDGSGAATHQVQAVQELTRADDQQAWHTLQPEIVVASMRRSRRIDVWLDGELHIDAFFQDSCMTPSGVRVGVHEYTLRVVADPSSGEILLIDADPRILPFDECPGAAKNIDRILGMHLHDLRSVVPRTLSGTIGCTHLNDMLRSLTDVPGLVQEMSEEPSAI